MPKPNVLVDAVKELGSPAAFRAERPVLEQQHLAVVFSGGDSGLLDMSLPQSNVWLEVLQSRLETSRPVYVELEPKTGVITELLLPMTVTVESIEHLEGDDGVEVQLVISHARHFLRSKHAGYRKFLRVLEEARKRGAQVSVTETPDTHEIIDVRPVDEIAQQRSRST